MIRKASAAERSQVVDVVTAAFAEDPAWAFLFADEYARLAPQFAGTLFDLRIYWGTVWVSDDLATVAMWDGPSAGNEPQQLAKEIWGRYVATAGEPAHERLIAYKEALAVASPPDPYWYLGVLATSPSRQREGLASAVLAPALERADADGVPCCLETSRQTNRLFYERRGFVEATDVALADGPPTWWLRRPPGTIMRPSAR